jgi:hypothetical protein
MMMGEGKNPPVKAGRQIDKNEENRKNRYFASDNLLPRVWRNRHEPNP